MAAKANSRGDSKRATGAAFVVIGGLVMAWQLGAFALSAAPLLRGSLANSPMLLTEFGLASLHALRSAAFHPVVVAWFVAKMLVLFFAFGIIVTGLALLRDRAARPAAENLRTRESRRGDQ